ncbi:MAG: PAS domain-containing protein, partial [Bacteroidota bacterium]
MKIRSQKLQFEQERNLLLKELADLKNKKEFAENELKKQGFFLHKTEQIASIGYWNLNVQTKIFTASEGARRIYGFNNGTITLEDVKSCRLPEYAELMDNALKDLVSGTKPYDVTFKIKRKSDGSILTLHLKADYHREDNHIFGIVSDITEQVHQMEQRSAMEQKWKGVIESTPVPMAINDVNANITFLNSAFTNVFGYT